MAGGAVGTGSEVGGGSMGGAGAAPGVAGSADASLEGAGPASGGGASGSGASLGSLAGGCASAGTGREAPPSASGAGALGGGASEVAGAPRCVSIGKGARFGPGATSLVPAAPLGAGNTTPGGAPPPRWLGTALESGRDSGAGEALSPEQAPRNSIPPSPTTAHQLCRSLVIRPVPPPRLIVNGSLRRGKFTLATTVRWTRSPGCHANAACRALPLLPLRTRAAVNRARPRVERSS
jgi:hypothetical protein